LGHISGHNSRWSAHARPSVRLGRRARARHYSISRRLSRKVGSSGGFKTMAGMAQNFLDCDREQELLLPPSLREWLPPGALGVVRDRGGRRARSRRVYASYREDGWGRAAHEPAMMVALLLYSYAVGERSSRAIERRCQEDIAFRVITADQAPDHATVARFRQSRGRAGRAIQRRAWPVRRGRAGARGGARDRRHEGARQRLAAHHARLRADRQRDPGRGGGRRCGRGRSSVRRAATSCPRN
jgi:transposase